MKTGLMLGMWKELNSVHGMGMGPLQFLTGFFFSSLKTSYCFNCFLYRMIFRTRYFLVIFLYAHFFSVIF